MKNSILVLLLSIILFSCGKLAAPNTTYVPPNINDSTHPALPTLDSDLVAYYSFTGNANDSVNNLNGSIHNVTLTTDRFNNPNSAYSFNGSKVYEDTITTSPYNLELIDSGSYIEIPDNNLLHFAPKNQLSICYWVRLFNTVNTINNLSGSVCMISKTDSFATNQTGFQILSQGVVVIYENSYGVFQGVSLGMITNAGNVSTETSLGNYLDTNWHMVTETFNSGTASTYIDTTLLNTTTSSQSLSDNSSPLLFGKVYSDTRSNIDVSGTGLAYTNYASFSGDLDDIRIYNRAITASEVTSLYYVKD
jgi:hypothetical protein